MTNAPKPRKCKVCKKPFTPQYSTIQATCNDIKCVVDWAKSKQGKKSANQKIRADRRKRKQDLKSKQDLTREAQKEFNRFIRERDHEEPCISCGTYRPKSGSRGAWDAGHYLTTGARPELRFNEDNCHKQCKQCNSHFSGNVAAYRLRLMEKIGVVRVEQLEGPHDLPHWTREDLINIKKKYRRKANDLKQKRQ